MQTGLFDCTPRLTHMRVTSDRLDPMEIKLPSNENQMRKKTLFQLSETLFPKEINFTFIGNKLGFHWKKFLSKKLLDKCRPTWPLCLHSLGPLVTSDRLSNGNKVYSK